MIHTISVHAGDSNYALAAQEHAIEMAKRFEAVLRAVSIWDPEDASKIPEAGEDPVQLAARELAELVGKAKKANVPVEENLRGEGFQKALLAEAQRSDLLVVGMPTEGSAEKDALVAAILEKGVPVLRKAECSVLVVCRPPQPIKNVLVDYQGGIKGKAALRMAGEIALRYDARVTVSSTRHDALDVKLVTAQQYLEGFRLWAIDLVERTRAPKSDSEIIEVAETSGADIIVIAEEPYGLLDEFLGKTVTEDVVLGTALPVLIAR